MSGFAGIDRDLLVDLVASQAGNAASGLVGGLILASVLAPAFALAAIAAALARSGTARDARWRRVAVAILATILLSLAVEFAGDEAAFWYGRGAGVLAFAGLTLGLLALPFARWRGRTRGRPRPRIVARSNSVARRPGGTGARLLLAAGLLASTVVAALVKHQVYPEALAWSAFEAAGLALVAAPFAWLIGRVTLRRRRGAGTLALAATVALSGWLSLAARPLLVRQTTSAMQELATMVAELNAGEEVRPRAYDRWRFGQCAPLVQGMGGFYRKVQVSLKALDGLEPILSDDSFRDAEALEATEARLSAWRRQLAAIEAEVGRSAHGLRRQIEAASISSDMREHLLAGVDDGLEGGPVRLTGSLTPLLDAVEKVVTFVKARRGRYWHEGSDLVFETDADAARFNRLLDGMREEQARLQGLVAANRKRAQEKAEAFSRWAQDPFRQPRPPRE